MILRTRPPRRLLALLAATLFLGGSLRAQELIGLAPSGDPNEPTQLTLSDQPLDSVLVLLEMLTGRTVIRPQALPLAPITFNNNPDPARRQIFTRAEAVVAIESLLSINGVGIAPLGEKFIKVVPLTQVQQEAPELVVGSLRDVPASGRIVSKIFRLQFLDPTQFQSQLGAFLSLQKVSIFQNSNTVVVTDTVSNLQRVELLLAEIDKRLNIETKFYQIQYASASELAQSIRSTIDSARSGSTGGRVVMQQGGGAPVPAGPAVPGAPGAQQIVLSTNTSINADERTNQLIIITDPANIPFFDDMIAKLDVPADPPTAIEVIPMRYADAEELAGLLSQFTANRISSSSRGGTSGSRTRGRAVSTPFPSLQPLTPQNPLNPQPRELAVQDAVQGALEGGETQFSQLLTIQPDKRTNALVVSGTVGDLRLITKVIDQLDVLLAQVRIEVVVAEVTITGGLTRGIDAFALEFSQPPTTTGGPRNTGTLETAFGPLSGTISGIWSNGRLEDITIDAVLSAGRRDSRVNILSTPTIATMHNREAKLIVGSSQPIVTGTTQSGISDNITSSFQYQDIATQLTVTPKVGPNNVIEMQIEQQIDDVAGTVTVGRDEQPLITRRQASSTLAVQDGQMIVLGGLQKNSATRSRNRMFLLGEIPLLDKVFSRTGEDNTRTELVVFIKPKVIRTMEEAHADALGVIGQVHVTDENARRLEQITGAPTPPPAPPEVFRPDHPKPRRPASR